MRLFNTILALLFSICASAANAPSSNLGRWSASAGNGAASPLDLPLATSGTPIFTFRGSFRSAFHNSTGALSVSGSLLYASTNFVDPYDSSVASIPSGAVGAMTIPTLTGTPAYDGSNGTATVATTCNEPTGTTCNPIASANIIAPANYTIMAAPTGGSKSAVFAAGQVPVGFAANAGWYVKFNGVTHTPDELITSWDSGTNTFSWASSLPTDTYTTTVSVHQFQPLYPFGGDANALYKITGLMVYGGKLYVTGAIYYDSACTTTPGSGKQTGWILSANTDLSNWGASNSVSGYPTGGAWGSNPDNGRRYSGALSPVPALWQSVLGNPAYTVTGQQLSILSCNVPVGFQLSTFDPSTVITGTGNAVAITPFLDYPYTGPQADPNNPTQISYRVFSGPFPLSGPYNGTYTLTAAPTAGATSVTLTSPFPNNGVTGFYDTTSAATTGTNSTTLVAAAPSGGWPANWAANYWVGGFILDPSRSPFYCRVGSSTAVTQGSTGTMTLTCLIGSILGMASGDAYHLSMFRDDLGGEYLMTFGGSGEQRVVELKNGVATVPYVRAGGGATVFSTLTGCSAGVCTVAPLTCSPSCTTSVTIAPLADQYSSEYDGNFGTAFIEPGSRTLLVIYRHQYGPGSGQPLASECNSGASGSNNLPLSPDTHVYQDQQVSAYDMRDLVNQKNGTPNPLYTATPYAEWEFPGWANETTRSDQCVQNGGLDWMYYDQSSGILYGAWVDTNSTANIDIGEWSVASM